MRKLLLACTALAALSVTPASAVEVITLTQLAHNDPLIVPQSKQNPAVIAGTQAQNPTGFGFNNFVQKGGNNQSYNMFSTDIVGGSLADGVQGEGYTAGFLRTFISSQLDHQVGDFQFGVAIDVNTAQHNETLNSFTLIDVTKGTIIASLDASQAGIFGNIGADTNGNGKPDYVLTGFNIASSLQNGTIDDGDRLLFHANWSNGSDGFEQFYLVAGPAIAAVPEPSTWAMMLLGFLGIAAMGARKQWQGFRLA